MRTIELTRGKFAYIDDEDFEMLSSFTWQTVCCSGHLYARTQVTIDGTLHAIYMHRLIIGAKDGEMVDHRNGNGLDNRRFNIRLATRTQNNRNSCKRKNNVSGFKGVTFHKQHTRWSARIKVDKRVFYLGYFDTPEKAATAYNEAAKEHFGEFAWLNQIPNQLPASAAQ